MNYFRNSFHPVTFQRLHYSLFQQTFLHPRFYQQIMSKRSSTPNGKSSKKLKLSAPGSLDHVILPEELEGKLDFKPSFKTKDNIPWNVKVVSWNVNGIRAVAKSKKFHYVKFEDPDVLCLQETKCAEEDFSDECRYLGYHKYYNSASKKGYSSTALFSKTKPLTVTYDIGITKHDSEGRVITAEFEGFYVVNVYVPNSGRKLDRLPYRRTWNTDFLDYCSKLDKKKPVIVAGDLNVAHTEIDLANPKSNHKNSGFTPEEREDFTTWLGSGFIDSFRHFHPEKKGAYTFWTYMGNARARNVGWRIDYFVVSERFAGNMAASEIREIVKGSDHCPIMLLLVDPSGESVGKPEETSDKADEENTEVSEETKVKSDSGVTSAESSVENKSDESDLTPDLTCTEVKSLDPGSDTKDIGECKDKEIKCCDDQLDENNDPNKNVVDGN